MKDLKLIQKLTRRSKNTKRHQREFDRHDKADKREETLAKSPRAYKLAIKVQRRVDSSWGTDMVAQKPAISFKLNASTLERHDYGVNDFGIRATLAADLITASSIRPGDVVAVLEGALKGRQLKVVAITDSTHLRLEDASVGKPEITEVQCIAETSAPEISSVTTVADVAGSLNNTYFTFSDANDAHKYYAWYNVSAGGTDPLVAGRTGIEVDISTGDSANAVATATRAAITAAAGSFISVSGSSAQVILTNLATGNSTDAADGAVPTGFTIMVTQQGVASNLNNNYFYLNAAADATMYYVWYNVAGAGTDPSIGGKTGIQVNISSLASASTVASATASAIGLVSDFSTLAANAGVKITNTADGAATDATAQTSGFSISVLQQGSNDTMSLENDVILRLDLSTVKASYL